MEESPLLRGVYIIDADNTLWDTNEVFVGAQLKMIEALHRQGCRFAAEEALVMLRALDLRIALALDDFEYDFSRLACALLLAEGGLETAVQSACAAHPPEPEWETAGLAGEAFYAHLGTHVPSLFAGVPETLAALRAQGNTLVLHSEGQPDRILQTLAAHSLEPLFDALALERKSRESFQRARQAGEDLFRTLTGQKPDGCIVVGDSPKRDIRFGNQIGATTVFKPGGWLGAELPDDPSLMPHFTIGDFSELLDLGRRRRDNCG